jgi:hypothetical protein
MLYYQITPTYKKSLVEKTYYKKYINTQYYTVVEEILWRGGTFNITIDEQETIPNRNNTILLNDYDFEMVETYDSCECEHYILDSHGNQIQDGPIYDRIMSIIGDSFYLLEDEHEWTLDENEYIICNGFDIEEIDCY